MPRLLRQFLLVSAALTALCLITELVCAYVLHLLSPYNWPLTPRPELYYDLNGFFDKFAFFHTHTFFDIGRQYSFSYPAPMGVLYEIVYAALPNQEMREQIFLALLALTVLIGVVCISRKMTQYGLGSRPAILLSVSTALLAYPFWFEAKQGNLEFFVFLLIATGTLLFLKGRGYSSAACFALAGSMKVFPLVFLGLHLAQRRWRPFFVGLALVPVITLFSLWLMVPDIPFAWAHLQTNIAEFQTRIVLHVVPREIGFDHSLFSFIKRILQLDERLLRNYMVTTALAGIVIFFARIRRLPLVNQILALTLASILLPPVSYDYTLIHLYVPLALLFCLAVQSKPAAHPIPGLAAILILLAAALSPLSEFIHQGVRFGGQMRALILLTLFTLTLIYPLRRPQSPAPVY